MKQYPWATLVPKYSHYGYPITDSKVVPLVVLRFLLRLYSFFLSELLTSSILGTWSGEPLHCMKKPVGPTKCPAIPTSDTSLQKGISRKIGAIVTFSCRKKFPVAVGGDHEITCLESGKWSGEALICEGILSSFSSSSLSSSSFSSCSSSCSSFSCFSFSCSCSSPCFSYSR